MVLTTVVYDCKEEKKKTVLRFPSSYLCLIDFLTTSYGFRTQNITLKEMPYYKKQLMSRLSENHFFNSTLQGDAIGPSSFSLVFRCSQLLSNNLGTGITTKCSSLLPESLHPLLWQQVTEHDSTVSSKSIASSLIRSQVVCTLQSS